MAGALVILVIIFRKFLQLRNLDVASLPTEREARKKKELLTKRIVSEGEKLKVVWSKRFAPLIKLWGRVQLAFRIYVGKVERLWQHERVTKKVVSEAPSVRMDKEKNLEKILSEAQENLKLERLEQAEELFIAAIKINKRSEAAYRGLADTYLARCLMAEAKETYKFLLQLNPNDDLVAVKLAEIAEEEGGLEEAIQYYQQAVLINDSLSPRFYHLAELLLKINQPATANEAVLSAVALEPKNPKYLDLLIETAIICGDQALAERVYQELRLINPENNKLVDFKDRIGKL